MPGPSTERSTDVAPLVVQARLTSGDRAGTLVDTPGAGVTQFGVPEVARKLPICTAGAEDAVVVLASLDVVAGSVLEVVLDDDEEEVDDEDDVDDAVLVVVDELDPFECVNPTMSATIAIAARITTAAMMSSRRRRSSPGAPGPGPTGPRP